MDIGGRQLSDDIFFHPVGIDNCMYVCYMVFRRARVTICVYNGNRTKGTTNEETVVISIGDGWRRDASAVAQTKAYVSWTIDTCEGAD